MGDREVYIKRMEAAVLQAGAAICKLKAENAALKKENDEFKAKIESISNSDKNTHRKDQLAGVECDTMRMEATKGVQKSLGSVTSMTSVKAVHADASANEAVVVERASSRSIGLSVGAKILTVPAVKKNLVSRKSIAMSGLEIGEGLVGVTHDEPAMEPDTKELSVAKVNANVNEISKPDIADIFLQAAARIKEQSSENTNVKKRISRPLPDIDELCQPVAAEKKESSSGNVRVIVRKKTLKPLPYVAEALPHSESLFITSDTSSIQLTSPAVDKQLPKKLPEQGWEIAFTAGSYSDKKFVGKQFQIRSTLKGAFSLETQKELLPNDTIQLLIANTDEKNVHSVAKSLRRFSPEIVAKHLMDHLRHIAYDPELYKDINNARDSSHKDRNQSEEFVDINRLEKLPAEFILRIDRLVLLIVSMYSRSASERTKVYALMRLLRDAALGVLRNRIEHSLQHFFDASIKTTVSKLRGRERRETIVAHLSDVGKRRAVESEEKGGDESSMWTIRDDSTLETYPAYSSNPVDCIDSAAVTKSASISYAQNAVSEGAEHVHDDDTDALRAPLAVMSASSTGYPSRAAVDKGRRNVEKINDMRDEERMDVEDGDEEAESRRANLAMMMGLDASSSESESEDGNENESEGGSEDGDRGGNEGTHEKEYGDDNGSDFKYEKENNEETTSINSMSDDDAYHSRNASNHSVSDARYMEESNQESHNFSANNNHTYASHQESEEQAQYSPEALTHEKKAEHNRGYNSDEDLCLATGPKGDDSVKGRNPSDRLSKDLHEAAAAMFITALGLRTGLGLFVYGYLSDIFLLTASNPSLGAIIGLAHTLAPSTPGRYGGHLHQLSPWGMCLSLCFHGFQEQLLAVKTSHGIIETNSDGVLQKKYRNGTILGYKIEDENKSDKGSGWLITTKDKIQEIQNYYSCTRKKKPHENQNSPPTDLKQFVQKKMELCERNVESSIKETMNSGLILDDDIQDIFQMQYLARKIGAWRALEICSRVPPSMRELMDQYGCFRTSEMTTLEEEDEFYSIFFRLGDISNVFSIFGFSGNPGLREESLATLFMLNTTSSLFEVNNTDLKVNEKSHDSETESKYDLRIHSELVSSESVDLPEPFDQLLQSAISAKDLIFRDVIPISDNKSTSVKDSRVDMTNVDANGVSKPPENDCTFTYVGNLLLDTFKENWGKHLKEIDCLPESFPIKFDVASSIKMVKDALTIVVAITAGSMSEFDALNNGWRTGVSGGGIPIEVRLQSRIEMVKGLIRTLNLSWFLHVQDLVKESSPSFKIFEGTSVSPARLSESAHLLDHCIQEIKLKIQRHKPSNLQDNLAENISKLCADSDVDEKKSWALLGDCLKDMTSLIAAALFERVLILTAQSVRALLTVCGEMEAEICSSCLEAQSDFSSLLVHSIRFLISTPLPWGPTGCAVLTHELMTAVQLLQRVTKCQNISKATPSLLPSSLTTSSTTSSSIPFVTSSSTTSASFTTSTSTSATPSTTSHTTSSSTSTSSHSESLKKEKLYLNQRTTLSVPLDLSMWVNSMARCTPAFIINLDRRPDRWHKIARMCCDANMTALRVSAIDGIKVSDPSRTWHTTNNADSTSCIPECDVALHWDSTLNSTFDAKCTINKNTPFTPSERACAASHLKVWRNIAKLREAFFKFHTGSKVPRTSGSEGIFSNFSNNSDVSKGVCGVINTPHTHDDNLESISRECYSLCKMGGGYIPILPQKTDQNDDKKKKRKINDLQNHQINSMNDVLNQEENDDWYLILEDDAELSPGVTNNDLQYTLNKIIQQKLPRDFDMCYLGHVIPRNSSKTFFRGGDIVKPNYAWCLHAYVLRGRAVDVLLKNLPINAPVDNFIGQLLFDDALEGYAVTDQLFRQKGTFQERKNSSDIRHSGRVMSHWDRESAVVYRAAGSQNIVQYNTKNQKPFKKK